MMGRMQTQKPPEAGTCRLDWEKPGAGGRSRASDSAGDSSARVGSCDARPAGEGGVRQPGTLASPNPQGSVHSGAAEKRPIAGMLGRPRTCDRQELRASQAGPSLWRAAARAPEVYGQLTAASGAEGPRRPRSPQGEGPGPDSQPQPGPDPGRLTRSPAPRAPSIPATAEAAPVNNTPHPLRAGTSGVRHLTSGGAQCGSYQVHPFFGRTAHPPCCRERWPHHRI